MTEDAELVARAADGETAAFGCLVSRYQELVFRVVVNLLNHRHDAEDVAQDVFLAAYAHLATFDSQKGAFRTWLLTIARNRCRNWRQRRRPLAVDLGEPADERTPLTDAESSEFFAQLDRAVGELPFDLRSAFVFAEIEGMAYDEIAAVEGIPLGTVKSRVHRAKARLRSHLKRVVELPDGQA